MKQIFFLLFSTLTFSLFANTNGSGHNIRVKLENYPEKTLVLGFYYGEKTYVKDTAEVDTKGWFSFKADTLLPCGMYLLVLQPENNFIQFALSEQNQDFSMNVDAKDPVNTLTAKGSPENEQFYAYMKYLGSVRPIADTLRSQFEAKKSNKADSLNIIKQLDELDGKVKAFQAKTAEKNKSNIVGKIINAAIEPVAPEFKGPSDSVQLTDISM